MIVRDGDEAFAWRVRDGRLQKVRVKLGDRDPRSGEYRLEQGLVEGDTLIRYPGSSLHDGQAVRLSG
jgi:membrane fusion protein (multidrug efflux system)